MRASTKSPPLIRSNSYWRPHEHFSYMTALFSRDGVPRIHYNISRRLYVSLSLSLISPSSPSHFSLTLSLAPPLPRVHIKEIAWLFLYASRLMNEPKRWDDVRHAIRPENGLSEGSWWWGWWWWRDGGDGGDGVGSGGGRGTGMVAVVI